MDEKLSAYEKTMQQNLEQTKVNKRQLEMKIAELQEQHTLLEYQEHRILGILQCVAEVKQLAHEAQDGVES